jgi:hypothetical protein
MWCDRQGIIEGHTINLKEDLPHFLLLLLILQRLNGTRSGSFKDCPESGFYVQGDTVTAVFEGQGHTFVFYPKHDKIRYADRKFTGRGTFVFGGREGPAPLEPLPHDVRKIQKGNDYVVKICWPEDDWTSEVDVLKKAREYGEETDLVRNHIPDMVCYLDPTWMCSSTKTIRHFLDLPTEGSRVLRIIVFRRLTAINALKEEQMLTVYLQCFFCE